MYKIIELEIDPELSGDTGVFEVAWVEYPAIEQELMYFGKQNFYKATNEVSAVACRAIKENEKRNNKAATQVGKIRGQQLCNQDEISLQTIKRMKSYLERAKVYNSGNWDDKGTISWHLWGGQEGLDWVDRILKQEENLGIQDFVKPNQSETKDEFIQRCIPVLLEEGKTPEQAAGQCYGQWDNREFEKGVPHYTEDGELYEGPTHKDASGRLMTGAEHTPDSEYLYHEGEFAEVGPRGGIRESKKAPASDTKNPNPKGVGTAKGKATDTRSAEVSERVEKILKDKSDDFNERYKDKLGYGVNVGMLKSVYQRGVGAFNTSHSPRVSSAEQWALARVNAFLLKVRGGSGNPKYVQDDDLLPSEHPKKEKMSAEFAVTRVGFDWQVLKTQQGKRLFNQEMSRGSLPVIFIQGLPTKELLDFTRQYGIPISAVNMYSSDIEKVKLIKDMGLERHYDLDFDVRNLLETIAVKFDYDVTGLPDYDNYPASGDTDAMLVEPTFYDEYCGCDLEIYDEEFALSEYSFEELEAYDILMEFKKTNYEEFAEFVKKIDGRTESEVKQLKLKNPTTFFRYDRKVSMENGPDRPECMEIQGKYFRRMEIDLMRNLALKYGHNGQPYSKWLWKFGPNCVHAWRKFLVQENNFADLGWAEGQAGLAMLKETANNGYFSPRTQSQEMSSVSYMKDIECAFGDLCKIEFSKHQEHLFAAQDEERMIYTPLMIPNILIPRIDEVSEEKYYVKFKPEVIKNIRDKFMAELRNRKTNYEHSNKKFEDIVMVETWIVQGDKDKAYELGFTQEQIPFGTWMGAYKVLDTKEGNFVWDEYIKPGKIRGASVEGNFILNFSALKADEYLLQQVINILKQITD